MSKHVAAAWEATAGVVDSLAIPVPAPQEPVAPIPENNRPVTIGYAAAEFLSDIEARQMDEATRRKYRTMLK